MTKPDNQPPAHESLTLASIDVVLLAELLDDLDGFLRSPHHHEAIWAQLRDYCARNCQFDPGYLIDTVSIFAEHLGELTAEVDHTDAAYWAVAEGIDPDCDEGPPW
jgi:hypothetical protein